MYRWLIVVVASVALAAESHAQVAVAPSDPQASRVPNSMPPPNASSTRLQAPRAFTEDWSTIALDKSGLPLAATGGPVLSKVEGPGFTRELVRLQWRPADPIEVYVIRPSGVAKPPVIMYLYDYTSDTDRFRDDGWCKRATKDGFAAVGFVSALSGQRFHTPRLMKQWFVSELQEALATSTHDVQMILNYMDSRGDLDMNSVGLFGQGSGGAVAILAAAADSRIAALDVFDPWGSWPEWLKDSPQIPEAERATYLKPEFIRNVSTLDPVTFLPQLKQKYIRVEEVLEDPITPAAAREKVMAAVPRQEGLVRYADWDAHERAYRVNGLSGWLEHSLREAAFEMHGSGKQHADSSAF